MRRLPGARRAKSAGCGVQPGLEAPDPGIGLSRLGGAASRHFIRRGSQPRVGRASMRSLRCCTDAAGGGRPNTSGTMGSGGAQHRGEQGGQVEFALARGAYDAGEDLLGVGALAGAVAAAHFADDDGGPDGLFGAPVGGVDRRVPQKREEGLNSVARARRAISVVRRRLDVDRRQIRASSRPSGDARPWALRPPALRPICAARRPASKVSARPALRWGCVPSSMIGAHTV